ncbi:MAG: TolC family protein [Candidatus Marinimicrobia bacterium]|nr:TolC family protein [Candidatus Neomarinimicrobiota bacterium]MCF7839965.1 TolC family protein [Candidatus Neomarinimicrobiota bacterium]
MNSKHFVSGLALIQILIGTAFGQSSPNQNLLDSLIFYNQGIQAARSTYQSSQAAINASGVLPDPSLEITTSLAPIQTRNGPIDNQIMLGQKFPLWGKLKRTRSIAELKANIAWEKYQSAVVSTSFQMTKIWTDYLKLTRSLEILQQYSDELDSFRKVALTHYSTGQGNTQHPILKLQIEQSLIQSKTNNLQSELDATIHQLQALFDGHFSPEQFKQHWSTFESTKTETEWLALADQVNPMLSVKRSQERIAVLMKELNQKMNHPDLMAGMTYSLVGSTDLGGAVESGKDALGFKIGLNLPIWFKRNKARVQAAEITETATQQSTAEAWNQIQALVQSQIQDLEEINQTYDLYQNRLLPESRQMLTSAYSAYETGKISFLDLLDSERMTINVRLEFENVKARRTIATAKLLSAVGLPASGETHAK